MNLDELLIAAAKIALAVGSIGFIFFTLSLILAKLGGC